MVNITQFNSPPFGDGLYAAEPPAGNGINITDLFHIVNPKPDDPGINSAVDTQYPNVAIITFDAVNQFGGMWAREQLDLTMPFSTEMYLYLGRQYGSSGTVADGMTFTLQNDPDGINAIGGAGEGLGVYRGRKWTGVADYTVTHGTYLRNSLVVEFDTYRNAISDGAYVDDPGNAGTSHCALLIPRADLIYISDHNNIFNFTPVQQWVRFEAAWAPNDSGGGLLEYVFDGQQRSFFIDDIISTFGGTRVFWGFTGATGGYSSVQAAAITRLPIQELEAVKIVRNEFGMDIDQSAVSPGDIINYTVRVTANQIFSVVGPIIIEDTLSPFVELIADFVTVITGSGDVYEVGFEIINTNIMRINTEFNFTQDGNWLEVSFNVRVPFDAGGRIIYNSAVITADGLIEIIETNTTMVTVFLLPEKSVSNSSEAGKDGSAVTIGDVVIYDINFANFEEIITTVFITDVLSTGVDFADATHNGVYDSATHTVSWILPDVPGGAQGMVSLAVRVNETAAGVISDFATVQVGDNIPLITNTVENPVINCCPCCRCCPCKCCPCCRCCPCKCCSCCRCCPCKCCPRCHCCPCKCCPRCGCQPCQCNNC